MADLLADLLAGSGLERRSGKSLAYEATRRAARFYPHFYPREGSGVCRVVPAHAACRLVKRNWRGAETTSHVRGLRFESAHLHHVYARVVLHDAGFCMPGRAFSRVLMTAPELRAVTIGFPECWAASPSRITGIEHTKRDDCITESRHTPVRKPK